ncbi:MAG: histidinol dehydrogenase [Candidatus Latescibacterota bacterium]
MTLLTPEKLSALSPDRRQAIMKRSMKDVSAIYEDMRAIVRDIQARGDAVSLAHYAKLKPEIAAGDIVVQPEEIERAYDTLDPEVVTQLRFAAGNIERFHKAELERDMWSMEVLPGVLAGRITRAMDAVGCYVPGRRAFYPSSVLMTIIPARAAGVERVFVCTPPSEGMVANPATLVAADIAGADRIFKIGGPWAVGSMAYGTDTVPKVDKIVGPGNKYVTAAKMAVFGEVDIDSPAGPSESLILADEHADAHFLALDFLSQAEHDPDAAAVLVTPCQELAERVCEEIDRIFETAARREIIEPAVRNNSAVLIAADMEEALVFTNDYAAEHLQVVTSDPIMLLPRIKHAGSIFLGPNAPVPVGDYASGTNHVLPTGGCARMFGGLSVDDFLKRPTFQLLSEEGLRQLAPAVITLAEAEGLPMHARTVRARLEKMNA